METPQPDRSTVTVSFQSCQSLNLIWTHLHQISQLCGLCCLEETTATLVHCDVFLHITAATMHFLLLTRPQLSRFSYHSSDNTLLTSNTATTVTFFHITAVTMHFLLLTRPQLSRFSYNSSDNTLLTSNTATTVTYFHMTAVTIHFLLLTRPQLSRFSYHSSDNTVLTSHTATAVTFFIPQQ